MSWGPSILYAPLGPLSPIGSLLLVKFIEVATAEPKFEDPSAIRIKNIYWKCTNNITTSITEERYKSVLQTKFRTEATHTIPNSLALTQMVCQQKHNTLQNYNQGGKNVKAWRARWREICFSKAVLLLH